MLKRQVCKHFTINSVNKNIEGSALLIDYASQVKNDIERGVSINSNIQAGFEPPEINPFQVITIPSNPNLGYVSFESGGGI